jgi:hypothetical protein
MEIDFERQNENWRSAKQFAPLAEFDKRLPHILSIWIV